MQEWDYIILTVNRSKGGFADLKKRWCFCFGKLVDKVDVNFIFCHLHSTRG